MLSVCQYVKSTMRPMTLIVPLVSGPSRPLGLGSHAVTDSGGHRVDGSALTAAAVDGASIESRPASQGSTLWWRRWTCRQSCCSGVAGGVAGVPADRPRRLRAAGDPDTMQPMSEQSKWTVGSAIGLGLLLLALSANFNARFDDQSAQMAGLRAEMAGLRAEMADLRADVTGQIADLRADMRRLDDRLRAVEIAFGKVDQRLLILERVLIPAPVAGAPDE